MIEAGIEQLPAESAAEIDVGAVAREDFGHVVGFPERTRQVAVIDLPLALLGIGGPKPEPAIIRGPESSFEAQLKRRFGTVQAGCGLAGSLKQRLVRSIVDVAGVAPEQQIVWPIKTDGISVGRGLKTPRAVDQRGLFDARSGNGDGAPGVCRSGSRGRRNGGGDLGYAVLGRLLARGLAEPVVAGKTVLVRRDGSAFRKRRR